MKKKLAEEKMGWLYQFAGLLLVDDCW